MNERELQQKEREIYYYYYYYCCTIIGVKEFGMKSILSSKVLVMKTRAVGTIMELTHRSIGKFSEPIPIPLRITAI
jgi:hypothetical protein